MSRIFEALQRSEVERPGFPFSEPSSSAAELLQAVENGKCDVEEFNSVSVIASPDSRLVTLTAEETLAAEKFRYLGVRLRQLQQGRKLKKVLITSTIAEEGKSFVSANLATTLARRRQQTVLLLEGDLRRPVLAQQFGLPTLPGLSEWLQGDETRIENIYNLDRPPLWILPAGKPPENPLELIQSGKLSDLFERLTSWFDWIVIDSPPLLTLADTTVWARRADGVLLIVREGKTEKRLLKRGLEALQHPSLLGVVFNHCSDADQSNYYQRYAQVGQNSNAGVKVIKLQPIEDVAKHT